MIPKQRPRSCQSMLLTHNRPMLKPHWNQSIDLQSKSVEWFLYQCNILYQCKFELIPHIDLEPSHWLVYIWNATLVWNDLTGPCTFLLETWYFFVFYRIHPQNGFTSYPLHFISIYCIVLIASNETKWKDWR